MKQDMNIVAALPLSAEADGELISSPLVEVDIRAFAGHAEIMEKASLSNAFPLFRRDAD